MKALKKITIILFLFFAGSVFASTFDPKDFKLVFDEGVSYCQLTRIENLSSRSNFVRENMMIGAYFSTQTIGLPDFNFELDLSAYYPFYQAFNGMQQTPKNIMNYALDGYLALYGHYKKFKYVIISGSLGMHYMYQLTDEWHMHYLGLGTSLGLELPLSKRWTIVNRNFLSYDNANLGKNKNIQPFYGAYQYHINLGVRYSRKQLNTYSYIK